MTDQGSATSARTAQRPPRSVGRDDGPSLLRNALELGPEETPFPWQTRLLEQMCRGQLPRSLDLPTGLGKTATIAIWLVARSLGADLPRRLVYVVDRRAVVDQATIVAERLRDWVSREPLVSAGLGLHERPLPVSTLRGQHVDNREWLEDPSAPAIVVGTVDMVGSRLLFGGYRASRRMRPYMAGLLGHDTLFVLDEAHLVPPFERLLERITLDRDDLAPSTDRELASPPPPRLLSLSATGRSRAEHSFDLDENDLTHPVVTRRLHAVKRLTIEPLAPAMSLADCAADRAWALSNDGAKPVRCLLFLSKREDAEKASARLTELAGKAKRKRDAALADVELLVGGRRVFERTEAAARLHELGFFAGSEQRRDKPAFLIATSAGEVGVDLDADHMISDLVAWERMVQRLGRVNRRGHGEAQVVVLDAPPTEKTSPADADRREAVLGLLARLPTVGSGVRDGSPAALRTLQSAANADARVAAEMERGSTPSPLHPPLDLPTLQAWAMTSLHAHPGRPDIAPWLRGWIDDEPHTAIIWRTHLPVKTDGAALEDRPARRLLEAAPPHLSEVLEAETFRVVDWLGKRAKRLDDAASRRDLPSGLRRNTVVAFTRASSDAPLQAWTLRELGEKPDKRRLHRSLSGGELILDARFGGLSPTGLLDDRVDDVPPTLDGGEWLESVPYRVRALGSSDAHAIKDAVWRERERVVIKTSETGEPSEWLVVEKRRTDAATEEDRSCSVPQALSQHLEWTARWARYLAGSLNLPDEAARILELAARLHDEGKRAARWQQAFHAPSDAAAPYAKTRGPVNVRLLDGYRHELGSLPYAERDSEVAALPEDQRDLVLHLIASHHGFARPTIPTSGCDDAPPSALKRRATEIALRFARLQERWGPWGIAWWESLLRAADQQASRENDQRDNAATVGEA